MTRVVLIGLDGFPTRAISAGLTSNLWALAQGGGWAPDGGRSPLPSSTYPGFATLLTGVLPARHRVLTTTVKPGAVPGWAGAVAVEAPTVFDYLAAAGRRSAAIQGDHELHAVLRTSAATRAWPAGGSPEPGTPLDAHGYPTNDAVRPPLLAAAADPTLDFVFGHLNEADTLGHDLGPDHDATIACYRATDSILGDVIEALSFDWDETVLMVVSDHDMESKSPNPPIDLGRDPVGGAILDTVFDGGAAWVRLRPGVAVTEACAAIVGLAGVEECRIVGEALLLVVARPGWRFAPVLSASGYHGGAGAVRTVAVVGGGHGSVPAVARSLARRPPGLEDWTPTILDLLEVGHSGLDGRTLLGDALTRP